MALTLPFLAEGTCGETVNVSQHGALLVTRAHLVEGQKLRLVLTLDDGPWETTVDVRHTHGGVGVEFDSIEDRRLKEFLMTVGKERRRGRRRPLRLLVWMALDDEGEQGLMTGDLSLGGAFLRTSAPLELGQVLTLSVVDENNSTLITVRGEVVRIAPNGVGVRFTQVGEEARRQLVRMLAA